MDKKLTRRQAGAILGSAGVATAAHAQLQVVRTATSIHQEEEFKATPARIYEILLDGKQFAAFTADTAEVQPQAGAAFKLFGGRIVGRNVELVPNQRIVQAWRPASWPAGVYSIVKFELTAHGAGTQLVFDHTGFPDGDYDSLNAGWPRMYWEPLRKYLKS
jgi:activator of HSP90 ATPase